MNRLNYKDFTVNFTKAEKDSDHLHIEGYGSMFGNKDSYNDVVEKGAFVDSLKQRTPLMLWQHNSREPIGVWDDIKEDENGLFMRGRLPLEDSLVSGRIAPQLKLGSLKGLSIGYRVVTESFDKTQGVNYLKELDLREVSIVTMPANDQANITGIKSLDDIRDMTISDLSNFFKENLGHVLSGTGCKRIASILKDVENGRLIEVIPDNNTEVLKEIGHLNHLLKGA